MKVGDQVVVISNHICKAPIQSVGCEGIIVDTGVNGISGRVAVLLTDAILDEFEWLYDEGELEEGCLEPFNSPQSSYKVTDGMTKVKPARSHKQYQK